MLAAVLGWLGAIGTFVAYVMLTRGRLTSASLRYGALNTVGGLLGGTATALYGAWPSSAASFLWAALGTYSMISTYRRRRRSPEGTIGTGAEPVLAEPIVIGEPVGSRIDDGVGLSAGPLATALIDEAPGAGLPAR